MINEINKDNIFGERLKNLRFIRMQKTQKEFSEFLNIPQPTLSSYESGRNKPTIDVVINIANKCNVSIDWLCGRDEPQKVKSLGDVMSFLFELYEINEFSCNTTIYNRVDWEETDETDDKKRNWIQLMFYYNENWHNKQYIYSGDFCSILEKVYETYNRYITYDYPQDYYESQKKKYIEMYRDAPVTKIDLSGVPEEERLRLRMEYMQAELKRLAEKKD